MGIFDKISGWFKKEPKNEPTMGVSFKMTGLDSPPPVKEIKPKPDQPEPICPYCGVKYEVFPRDKQPCPSCGEVVIIKRRDKIKHLVTEAQAQEWEIDKKEQALFNKLTKYLSMGRIDPEKFHLIREGVVDDNGFKIKYELAAIQILANNSLKRNLKKDFEGAYWTYFAMTHYLRDHGLNYFDTLQLMHEMRLREMKTKESHGRVKITPHCDCDACKAMDGKILTIDEALKTMPFPPRDCTGKFPFKGRYSWLTDREE